MIYLIQLKSGEWLVSELGEYTSATRVHLKNPRVLRMGKHPQTGIPSVFLLQYVPDDSVTEFFLEKDLVAGDVVLTHGQLFDLYNQVLSPIALPPSSILVHKS